MLDHAQTVGLVWGMARGAARRAPHRLWLLPLSLLVLEVCSRAVTEWLILMLPVAPLAPRMCALTACCALSVCTIPQQRAVRLPHASLVLFRMTLVASAWAVAVSVAEVAGVKGSLTARV